MNRLLNCTRSILKRLSGILHNRNWCHIKAFTSRLLLNRYYILAEFVSACLIIAFSWEVEGAVAFFGLILAALVLCDDIMSLLPPLLYMSVFLTKCYDSADIFLEYIPLAIPLVLAIAFHLLTNKHKWQIGSNFWGLVSVAVAVTLGGLGTISTSDYFNVTSLYYTVSLGIGMIIVYLFSKAYIKECKGYNIYKKFAGIMYSMGALACFSVFCFYFPNWDMVKETHTLVDFQSSNNLATILMIAMPFSCYFSLNNKKHLLGLLLIYIAVIFSGSRGGLIMGTVEFFFCLAYLSIFDKNSRFTYICTILSAFLFLYINFNKIMDFYKIDSITNLILKDEARFGLLSRVKDDFKSNIFFGRGLGYSGNKDLYNPKSGAMHWYHMMLPQIVGSLGLVGVVAYVLQWTIRIKTLLCKPDAYSFVLGLSYLGLFLMSQVNPGEFCPIPYAFIAVLTFVMVEKYAGHVST